MTSHDYIDRQIVTMREAGASLRVISEATGLSESGVSHAIKRLGLPLRPTNPRKTDVDAEVTKRRAAGESLAQIAESLGVGRKTLWKRAAKLGVADPHKGAKRPRRRGLSDKTATYAADLADGMAIADIAARHGVSYQAVHAALRRREARD